MFKISSQAKFNKTKFVRAITALSKMRISIIFHEDFLKVADHSQIDNVTGNCDEHVYRRHGAMQYTILAYLSPVQATFSNLYK
jgi:hypothetical protein